ncbi:hypothetical protein, partial [Salmonella sp. SAL4448]|uniref:hypothetical protein n=1 Tax=Salmonella sp. SAL4448 TaxID=3159903 RepID=UPI00397BE0C9
VTGTKFPAALEGVIARALSKHPAQRHGSAREFAAAVAHSVDARIPFSFKLESRVLEQSEPMAQAEEAAPGDRSFQKAPLFI